MKDYCTEQERIALVRVIVTGHAIGELVEAWAPRGNLTGDEAKYLRCARTLVEKAYTSIIKRLKPGQGRLIIDAAERYSNGAKDEYCIDRTQLDRLMESALATSCSPCTREHDRKCTWREIFKTYNVPPGDGSKTGKGQCPYEQITCRNTFHLPCRVGDRLRYLNDGEWKESYIDCLSCDKRGWMLHPAAADFWLDMRDEGTEWEIIS